MMMSLRDFLRMRMNLMMREVMKMTMTKMTKVHLMHQSPKRKKNPPKHHRKES